LSRSVVRCRSRCMSFSVIRRPPTPPLFPYTTLFRSVYVRRSTVMNPNSLNKGVGAMVTRQELEGQWNQVKGKIQKQWGELTEDEDRKSTRLNSSHVKSSYAVFCLKKKKKERKTREQI